MILAIMITVLICTGVFGFGLYTILREYYTYIDNILYDIEHYRGDTISKEDIYKIIEDNK